MNEQERLIILKKLSSGEISAEKAGRLLSGAEELTTVIEVEVKPNPAEAVDMAVEAPEVDEDLDSQPQAEALQVEIKIDDEPKRVAKQIRFSAVDESGKVDIDIVVPVSLLKLGQQIGDRFAPTLDGWDWNTLDLDINLDTLHVRVAAE